MSFLNPPDTELRRRRLLIGGASILITTIVMVAFLVESRWGYLPPDVKLVYMQSWSADRTRADAVADSKATVAAQEARLAQARAAIGALSGEARKKAQEQYDRYVAAGEIRKAIPYVRAQDAGVQDVGGVSADGPPAVPGAAPVAAAAEPPVL
jgi:hypothetical protein